MGARTLALAVLAGLVAPCLALLAPGCAFPGVTFSDELPDANRGGFDGGFDAPSFVVEAGEPSSEAASSSPVDDVSVPLGDASCNFNGTWGTRITIDVAWVPQGLSSAILSQGQGTITQWVKGSRVQTATAPLALSDTSVLCGIALPDFQATLLGLNQVYGVRFPDTLFDDGYIPPFAVNGALTRQASGGLAYSTTPTVVLLGVTMANPTMDPWPMTITTEDDQDKDGNPGVTVGVAQGPLGTPAGGVTTYSYIPTDIPGPLQPIDLAKNLYLAIRQMTVATGTVEDCNTISGTVTIPSIGSKAAIDSHVLGCTLVDGGQCTTGASSEASFVDNSQPIFSPTGPTTFQSIRIDAGATCADVRNAFP
jgi:hypothetical protein